MMPLDRERDDCPCCEQGMICPSHGYKPPTLGTELARGFANVARLPLRKPRLATDPMPWRSVPREHALEQAGKVTRVPARSAAQVLELLREQDKDGTP